MHTIESDFGVILLIVSEKINTLDNIMRHYY